jgi:hypothetical protein
VKLGSATVTYDEETAITVGAAGVGGAGAPSGRSGATLP